MTKKEFIRIINKAGIPNMESALNLMAIAYRYMSKEDEKDYKALSVAEDEYASIIHEELDKIGFYK